MDRKEAYEHYKWRKDVEKRLHSLEMIMDLMLYNKGCIETPIIEEEALMAKLEEEIAGKRVDQAPATEQPVKRPRGRPRKNAK